MTDKKIEDIVLYHGSLAELNSRDSEKQYRFAEALFFISDKVDRNKQLKEQLSTIGYDGLVNMKTSIVSIHFVLSGESTYYRVEGTPILRV
ncbi:hypothetical protein HYV49_03185 [Candidatus Pacearchaeota archaeon]|nr:hypothetical protein [Candidatus Pacearchaeota archaeon]